LKGLFTWQTIARLSADRNGNAKQCSFAWPAIRRGERRSLPGVSHLMHEAALSHAAHHDIDEKALLPVTQRWIALRLDSLLLP
ncbi:hypothetical protein P0D75_20710, partial [Paraburkholderia sediminicola]|uniref:hypothetical protein n=1 Tax=Paraburkholderia sediminicola TaxID=458836 RepID=UPI0038B9EEFD